MIFTDLYSVYGNHKCSCGCDTVLNGTAFVVGDDTDEEGFDWRIFTPDHAHIAKLKCGCDWKKVYETYPPAESVDDYLSNMPCDTYGMCAGSSCSKFYECQGGR